MNADPLTQHPVNDIPPVRQERIYHERQSPCPLPGTPRHARHADGEHRDTLNGQQYIEMPSLVRP
jgi:hypothetical protein